MQRKETKYLLHAYYSIHSLQQIVLSYLKIDEDLRFKVKFIRPILLGSGVDPHVKKDVCLFTTSNV